MIATKKKVLGSFAMYYAEARAPLSRERRMIDVAASIAGLAIESQRAHEMLPRREAPPPAILRANPDWMFILSPGGVFLDYYAKDPDELLVPPQVFLGRTIAEILPPVVANPLTAAIAGTVGSG